jgi:hypothetical protein
VVLNRASIVYACLFAIFAGGIWVILRVGSSIAHAPEDLSGQWHALNNDSSMQIGEFTVNQSGKYFEIKLEDGTVLNLILDKEERNLPSPYSGSDVRMTISGQGWQVVATGKSHGNDFTFAFQSPPSASAHSFGAAVEYQRGDLPGVDQPTPVAGSSDASNNSSKAIADTK